MRVAAATVALAFLSSVEAVKLGVDIVYSASTDCTGATLGTAVNGVDGVCSGDMLGLGSIKVDCAGESVKTYSTADCSGNATTTTPFGCTAAGTLSTQKTCKEYKDNEVLTMTIGTGTCKDQTVTTTAYYILGCSSTSTSLSKSSVKTSRSGSKITVATYSTDDCSGKAVSTVSGKLGCEEAEGVVVKFSGFDGSSTGAASSAVASVAVAAISGLAALSLF